MDYMHNICQDPQLQVMAFLLLRTFGKVPFLGAKVLSSEKARYLSYTSLWYCIVACIVSNLYSITCCHLCLSNMFRIFEVHLTVYGPFHFQDPNMYFPVKCICWNQYNSLVRYMLMFLNAVFTVCSRAIVNGRAFI